MNSTPRKLAMFVGVALLGLGVAACAKAGSSGTEAPPSASTAAGCAPVAGEQLVVLDDDKKLQNSDNIVAAINDKAASPALLAAVDKVAAAVDTPKLIALNKAADIDRKTPAVVAQEFAATAGLAAPVAGGTGTAVKIGAANFSESQILGELYKIALNAAGFKATVQTIGNRELYEPALERGEIHVFPEYAATLTEFLNQKANGAKAPAKATGDITVTMTALKDLGSKYHLAFGTPSTATDQNAFAVTKTFAEKYSVKTLSEFAAKCSGTASVLAGPPECPQRPFCQAGLKDKYGIIFGEFHQLDVGGPQTKAELKTGKASLGLVFSSDGSLAVS